MKHLRSGLLAVLTLLLAGCVSEPTATTETELIPTTELATTSAAPATTAAPPATTAPPLTRPRWLGLRPVPTLPDGSAKRVDTPPQLLNRSFATEDSLPPPSTEEFQWTISPFVGEPLERSTYYQECPVPPEELSYLTLSFWGFDELHHTGEMVVDSAWAEPIVDVFRQLHQARFPIEEMRLVTPADLAGVGSGDVNNTTAYVCRAVTGGRRWSDHALGTALDINPFHNPYTRGNVVLPGLAAAYLDRDAIVPGMILADDLVVRAFSEIGWSWGGDWVTVTDYQHFSLSGR